MCMAHTSVIRHIFVHRPFGLFWPSFADVLGVKGHRLAARATSTLHREFQVSTDLLLLLLLRVYVFLLFYF